MEHGTNSHFYVVDILDKWTDQATSVGREGVGAWLGITKIVLETERRRGKGRREHRGSPDMYSAELPVEDSRATGDRPGEG